MRRKPPQQCGHGIDAQLRLQPTVMVLDNMTERWIVSRSKVLTWTYFSLDRAQRKREWAEYGRHGVVRVALQCAIYEGMKILLDTGF